MLCSMASLRPVVVLCLGLVSCMSWACSSKDLSGFNAGGGGSAGQAGGSSGSAGASASGGAAGSGASGGSGGTGAVAGAGTGGTGTGGDGTGAVGGGTGGAGTGGAGGCVPVTTNSGWEKPKTVTNGQAVGVGGWAEPNGAKSSDNVYATFNFSKVGAAVVLKAGNFGFQVPTNATILGIEIAIEHAASKWDSARDETIILAKAGHETGTNQAFAEWELNDKSVVYGGATQTWGVPNLSHSFVNAADFEVWVGPECFHVGRCNDGLIARVDEIRARIHYQTSCGN